MSNSGASESMFKVGVHPLVVASTCDHFTRVSTGGSKLPSEAPVYGLLFGMKVDGYYSVCDSVDINYTFDANDIHILPGEIESKVKLWTAVFTIYTLIGWYSFGAQPTADHNKFHEMMTNYVADPVFLLINQSALSESDELPLNVFLTEHNTQTISQWSLKETHFKIETSEVEKLALDHITKSTPVPGLSTLEVQNQSTLTSLRILDSKVGTIIDTLNAMREGKIPMDHTLLRSAAKICQSLPPVDAVSLEQGYSEEMTHSLMVTYLSVATKTSKQLEEVTETYNSVYGDRGMSHI